jgi:hypothetical protein
MDFNFLLLKVYKYAVGYFFAFWNEVKSISSISLTTVELVCGLPQRK